MKAVNLPSTLFVDIIVTLVTTHTASSILKRYYCYKSNTQKIGTDKIKVAQKNLNHQPVHINYYGVN